MTEHSRITIEPGKRGGRPCVRGLRIAVYDVLGWLASGMSEDDILRDHPDLERDDIRACLAFAADRERHAAGARKPGNLAAAICRRFAPFGGVKLELPPRERMREPLRLDWIGSGA